MPLLILATSDRENLDLSHIGKIDKIEIPKKDKLIEINYNMVHSIMP